MRMKWKKIVVKILLWLVAEIYLGYLGLDNLADYSEFIFSAEAAVLLG